MAMPADSLSKRTPVVNDAVLGGLTTRKDVKTTMVYTHVLNRGGTGVVTHL